MQTFPTFSHHFTKTDTQSILTTQNITKIAMSAPATPSLLGIPAELRNKIYHYALYSPKPHRLIKTLTPPPLCRTNRQIRAESIKTLRVINEFELDTYYEWSSDGPTTNDLHKRLKDIAGLEDMQNITWVNTIVLPEELSVARLLRVVLIVRGQEYVVQAVKGPYDGPVWERVWAKREERQRGIDEAESMLGELGRALGRAGLTRKNVFVYCQAGDCLGHQLTSFDASAEWEFEAQCWETWRGPMHRV
jgi:hypothetical protein